MSRPHQVAEKLVILGDMSAGNTVNVVALSTAVGFAGLMARLYKMKSYQKPEILNEKDADAFCKKMLKVFPNVVENNPEKVDRGLDIFSKHATNITSHLMDYYETFKELLDFKAEAWNLLSVMAATMNPVKFSENSDVIKNYLDLFTKYVKLHVMTSRLEHRRLFVAAYAKAYQCTSGNTEPDFARIAAFIHGYGQTPLKVLQTECEPLAGRLGDTLIEFMMPVLGWQDLNTFHTKGIFNLLEEPKFMTTPKGETDHLTLLNIDNFKHWVIWGYMACPAAISSEGAVSLLVECLKEVFVVGIFRDEVLQVHDEYNAIFQSYVPADKKGAFKLSKYKKKLRESYADPQATMKGHENIRTYLLHEMTTMIQVFEEFPHILAPKIHMCMAAMCLARNQIVWYFSHKQPEVLPYKVKANKHVFPVDARIPELIMLVQKLHDMILEHQDLVKQYYTEYLHGADSEEAKNAFTSFKSKAGGKSEGLIEDLIQFILDGISVSPAPASFNTIRLNWYRVAATIFARTSGITPPAASALAPVLTKVIVHTRLVDMLPAQLKLNGSFKYLYWYREDIRKMLWETANTAGRHGGALLYLIRTMESACDNIHRMCPEELDEIGQTSAKMTKAMLGGQNSITQAVCQALTRIQAQTGVLRAAASTTKVLARMKGAGGPLPGAESQWAGRNSVAQLRDRKRFLSELCCSIRGSSPMRVFQHEFLPWEFLYESLERNVKQQVSTSIMAEDRFLRRPTKIVSRLQDLMAAYQTIEHNLHINVSDIFQRTFLAEFSDKSFEEAGTEYGVPPAKKPGETQQEMQPAIHYIADQYAWIFKRDLGLDNVHYSPTLEAFVNSAASSIDAEKYTDRMELRALCTLVGPSGVRYIDKAILKVVVSNVEQIQKICKGNQTVIVGLQKSFTEQPAWLEAKGRLTAQDELAKHASIVGCCLKFRQLLRSALGAVVEERTPMIFKPVQHTLLKVQEQRSPIDHSMDSFAYLASDCGLPIGESDHMLAIALSKLRQSQTDMNLWALLPEFFGMALSSQRVLSSQYSVKTAGHTNNVHCMVEAIKAMLVCFIPPANAEMAKAEYDSRINVAYERFVKLGSATILHMHATAPNRHSELSNVMVFLEQFIDASDGRLTHSMLETCYPYTLLRTNYIELYEKQAKGTAYQKAKDDEDNKPKPAEPAGPRPSGSRPSANR